MIRFYVEFEDLTSTESVANPSLIFYCDIDPQRVGNGGTTDHAELDNLDYANSGHTGFEPARGADDNYVTDSEKAIIGALYGNVAFSANIPMNYMAGVGQGQLTGATDFTPNVTGAFHSYSTTYLIDANNITPTFSGFIQIDTGNTWDLTAGNINVVIFQRIGNLYYYVILPSYTGELSDTTPPVLSNIGAINILQDRFTLQAQSTEAGVIYWAIFSDTATKTHDEIKNGTGATVYGNKSTVGSTLESMSVVGLSPSSSYRARLFAEDASANQSTIGYYNLTTPAADITAPVPTFTPTNGSANFNRTSNITIVFNEAIRNINGTDITDLNIASLITLKETNSSGTDIPFAATISSDKTTVTIDPTSSLPGNTVIYVAINNYEDNYGNEQTSAQTITFTTASLASLSATTLTATTASQSQINLSWLTVSNVSSWNLEYSLDNSTNWTQIGGTIAAGTLSYNHTGLSENTTYYYRMTSVGDGTNYNNSSYATANATTSANQAPTVTVSLTGTPAEGQALTGSYSYSDNESDTENTDGSTGTEYEFKEYTSAANADADLNNSSGISIASGRTGGTNKTYSLLANDIGKYITYWVRPRANAGTTPGVWTKSAYIYCVTPLSVVRTETSYSGNFVDIKANNNIASGSSGVTLYVNSVSVPFTYSVAYGKLRLTVSTTILPTDIVTYDIASSNNITGENGSTLGSAISGAAVVNKVAAYDTDASTYFTNASITDVDIKESYNTFVLSAKSHGYYSLIKALYLCYLGNVQKIKYNAVNPVDADASFRLTYTGSFILSSSGMTGNNGSVANTHLVPSSVLSQNDASLFTYIGSTNSLNQVEIGVTSTASDRFFLGYDGVNQKSESGVNGPSTASITLSSPVGFNLVSRISSGSYNYYHDENENVISNTSGGIAAFPVVIGAYSSQGTMQNNSTRLIKIAGIGRGFTSQQASYIYQDMQAMLSELLLNN